MLRFLFLHLGFTRQEEGECSWRYCIPETSRRSLSVLFTDSKDGLSVANTIRIRIYES